MSRRIYIDNRPKRGGCCVIIVVLVLLSCCLGGAVFKPEPVAEPPAITATVEQQPAPSEVEEVVVTEPIVEEVVVVEPVAEELVATDNRAAALDAYMVGTPMYGYGATMVEAGDTYGVDPRSIAAVARLESGCGAHCFLSYNAWGWGQYSFSDWETAIWEYARMFSAGYGNMLTEYGVSRYCPGSPDYYGKYIGEFYRIY